MSELFHSPYPMQNQVVFEQIAQCAHELFLQGKTGESRALFHSSEFEADEWERSLCFGLFLLQTGNASEAIEQLSIVLDHAHQREENQLRSVACHNLAIAYRNLGYFELAAQFQQYSIAWGDLRSANHQTLEQEVEQLTDEASSDLTGRANDAILQRDFPLAEQLLNISLAREILYGSLDAQAADWGNLGIIRVCGENTHARFPISGKRICYTKRQKTYQAWDKIWFILAIFSGYWVVPAGRFAA